MNAPDFFQQESRSYGIGRYETYEVENRGNETQQCSLYYRIFKFRVDSTAYDQIVVDMVPFQTKNMGRIITTSYNFFNSCFGALWGGFNSLLILVTLLMNLVNVKPPRDNRVINSWLILNATSVFSKDSRLSSI